MKPSNCIGILRASAAILSLAVAVLAKTTTATAAPAPQDLYICTGGPATDNFIADAYYSGGTATPQSTAAIDTSLLSTPIPQAVLQSQRYNAMTYTIPDRIPNAQYAVTLYFVETYWDSVGQRTFNVAINGTSVLNNFDILATAGAKNKAVEKKFTATGDASGNIVISFTLGTANYPRIDGIAIKSSGNTPPSISPIADQIIPVGIPGGGTPSPIPFTISDAETPAENLIVSATSSDTTLFPPDRIVLGGSGTNRNVTLTPADFESWNATIEIKVTDAGGLSATQHFKATVVTVPPPQGIIDRNSDGISDVWAAIYPGAGGPTADPDGDGISNYVEARAGTSPFDPNSRFEAKAVVDAAGNVVLRWFGVMGKQYRIEKSTDLKNWTYIPTYYNGANSDISEIVIPVGDHSQDRVFWHVVVLDINSNLVTDPDGPNDWERTHMDYVASVDSSAGPNGTITPAGKLYYAKGSTVLFTIKPNAGYLVEAVLVDGTTVGSGSTFQFDNITAGAHSIFPTFKTDGTFSVTPSTIDLDQANSISVTSAESWTASSDQAWLTVNPLSGSGNGTITLSAQALTGTSPRSAKVTVKGPAGSPNMAIVTVTQSPDQNVAIGKTATASSTEGSYVPGNAVDASQTTRWSSLPTDKEWIKVDLGGVYTIKQVVLVWENAYGKSYAIEVSSDGDAWTSLYSTQNGAGGTEKIALNGVGRYVRMNGSARGTSWGYSLFDFQIYGKRAGHYLSAAPSKLVMPSSGAARSLTVNSDQSWTATTTDSWLKVTPASGSGDGALTVTASALAAATRTGSITISVPSDPALSQVINVTQTDTNTRVEDFLSQMSTAEKTEQLYGLRGKYFGQPINQRLGILGYEQADGPHGINWTPSTVFPVGIAAMATWDPEYMQVVGRAMAKEFRAHGRNQMLGPTLDLNRDPRYGRSPESGGEDPYLSGKVNAGIVRGAQAYGMVATAKHFVKTNKESNKDNENNTMNDRTLMDLYVKPFQIVIEDSNVFSIMNAYGKVNGPTCSESSKLQTEILRNRLGFKYFIVSDWNEVENTAASINAGNDICMGSDHYMDQLLNNVNGGQVSMATLNEAVRRALRAKVDSGIIDGLPPGNGSDLNSDANRDVALVEAQKSIVLLKNTGGILPLKANADSIALIGPNVKGTALDGRGSSWIDPTNLVTPFQGFTNKANGVTLNYAKGCDVNSTDTSGFAEALTVARNSKTVVFIGGLEKYQEGENGEGVYDRTVDSVTNQKSFQLPGRQQELINQLAAANPNIVVVIMSGGTCGVNRCVSNIKGLLYAYYPGIRGGDAIADIVFGNVNPSGKLPVTMAKNESQLPDWNKTDYSGDEIDGFGYRRFDKMGWTPEFAFGFGLSYTTFSYSNIKATSTSPGSGTVTVTADITNTGTVAGDEVAQLYLSHTSASVPMPVKQLAGFKRVSLAPGEKKTVTFSLTPNELSYWSMARNHFLVEAGSYTVKVGGSSDNLPLSATFTISSEFEIPYGGLK